MMNEVNHYHLDIMGASSVPLEFRQKNYPEFIGDAKRGGLIVQENKFSVDPVTETTESASARLPTDMEVLCGAMDFIRKHLTQDAVLIDWVVSYVNQMDTFGDLWGNILLEFQKFDLLIAMDSRSSSYNIYCHEESPAILYYRVTMKFLMACVGLSTVETVIQHTDSTQPVATYKALIKIEKKTIEGNVKIVATLEEEILTNYHEALSPYFVKLQTRITRLASIVRNITPSPAFGTVVQMLVRQFLYLENFIDDIVRAINNFVSSRNVKIFKEWQNQGSSNLTLFSRPAFLNEGQSVITKIGELVGETRKKIETTKPEEANYQAMGNALYQQVMIYKNTELLKPRSANGKALLEVLNALMSRGGRTFAVLGNDRPIRIQTLYATPPSPAP